VQGHHNATEPLLFIYLVGVEPSPLLLKPPTGQFYQLWMIYDNDCGATGEINDWQGKHKYSEKTCPNATLSTTNATFPVA
jgi:hypothetical protein